ncbi:hypothetical protein L2E82_40824 [Cichorium intybus]|uniref:Uncharacterized protein n=1 Tax=Cichorium intybus TaxID=13427 RepID=A0ACB9ALC7_CICIN|nr:hypothetical protein L2E82_40824 [Cichorium intybus]
MESSSSSTSFHFERGEVSRYVIGGAYLMFPGISIDSVGLPEFLAGQPWAVKIPGNPAPIAVGSTCMSSSEALKAGLCGKALMISHHYHDALWESVEGRYVPNTGFLEDVVFEDPSLSTNDATNDHGNNPDNIELEAAMDDMDANYLDSSSKLEPHQNISQQAAMDDMDANYPDSSSKLEPHQNISQQVTTEFGHLKVTENVESDKIIAEDQNTLSTEDVDALLDNCLLQAFYTTPKDKDFPIVGSKLCCTASEASEVVFAYIEKENMLKSTNKSIVVLDAILCDALFKGAFKKGSTYPSEIHKKDLATTFINRMQRHHQVTRGKESAVRKGGLKPLQIMTERRQGNKKVTKVSEMESFLIDVELLASELEKKFACSTSVTELPCFKLLGLNLNTSSFLLYATSFIYIYRY